MIWSVRKNFHPIMKARLTTMSKRPSADAIAVYRQHKPMEGIACVLRRKVIEIKPLVFHP